MISKNEGPASDDSKEGPAKQVYEKTGSRRKQKLLSAKNSKKFRWIFQIAFLILVICIGWKFILFVQYCESGGTTRYVSRPPGVEAFLPIEAFMGLKYFLATGKVNPTHPAGFIIFASILITSFLFQRGFCSWICPVGTISEWAWRFGDWIKSKFNKNVSYWLEKFPVKLTCGLSLITTPIIALMLINAISFDSFKSSAMKWIYPFMILAIILPFVLPRKIWPARVEDSIARAWKYSILAFFAVNIIIMMPATSNEVVVMQGANNQAMEATVLDIETILTRAPYIKISDIKMLNFFRHLSVFAAIVISLIFFFSIFNKNYWCRYFCPYGAFMGILGWASVFRIVRDKGKCIDCSKCTIVCPVYIEVEKKNIVLSPECLACYDCVGACPANGALDMKIIGSRKKVHYAVYAGLAVGLFVVFMNTAKFTGYWYNNISDQDYVKMVSELDTEKYKHERGKFKVE